MQRRVLLLTAVGYLNGAMSERKAISIRPTAQSLCEFVVLRCSAEKNE